MSNPDKARRTEAEVYFDGVNISRSMRQYLLSLTYTDNEEDEADDLQIVVEDRDDVWLCQWLDAAIQAAAASGSTSASTAASTAAKTSSTYKVNATALNVRSGAGTKYAKVGLLAYGAQISVSSITNGWAKITYSGKTAYVSASYITAVSSVSSSGKWVIGDAVIANGRPQYTSYGEGTPGANVTNYKGSITHLNLKSGVKYPICVGQLGWFAESQVKKASASASATAASSSVTSSAKSTTVKGMSIQAAFVRENWNGDGKDKVLDCGQFELDQVEASGPPSTISIKGTALPYSTQIRQTRKSKAWESYTLSGIAKEMASLNGMACLYESDSDPVYSRVEQIAVSDIQFLSTLCHNAGISLKTTNNILVLFDQATFEAKDSILTIKRKDGSYIKHRLSTGEADKQYASCRVCYTDPATRSTIEATAYVDNYDAKSKNNQCLEIWAKVSSVAEAKALAEKRLRLHNKYEKSASFTLPGNPDLMAGLVVTLEDWGGWSGKYIIKQAQHSISSSGYTTQIRLRATLVDPNYCDTTMPFTKKVGQTYQFKSGSPITVGNSAIWQHVVTVQSSGYYLTKFKAVARGSAGFYMLGKRVCIGTVI